MKNFVVAKILKIGEANADEYLFPEKVIREALDRVQELIRNKRFFVYHKQVPKSELCFLSDVIGVVQSMTIHEGYLWADIEFVDTKAGSEFRKAIEVLELEGALPELFRAIGLGSANDEKVVERDYDLQGICVRPLYPSIFVRKNKYEEVG